MFMTGVLCNVCGAQVYFIILSFGACVYVTETVEHYISCIENNLPLVYIRVQYNA